MNIVSKEEYSKMVSAASKPSPIVKDTLLAFLVGGGICVLGQILLIGYEMSSLDLKSAKNMVSCKVMLEKLLSVLFLNVLAILLLV